MAFNQSLILVGAFIILIITDVLIVYGFILMVNQRLNGENDMLVQRLEVEKKIGKALKSTVIRSGDTVARYGE